MTTRSGTIHRPADAPAAPEPPDLVAQLTAHVLDALEDGVVALDRERKVVYANRWIEDLLGFKTETLIGLPGSRLFPGADARWLKGATRERRDFKLEAEGREHDRSRPSRCRSATTRASVIGSVILAEAISETEDGEFQKKIDRLVSLGELSAYVAHEIRNPLTGIRTTVQFVGSSSSPPIRAARTCRTSSRSCDRIEQIITGLLMFARPPAAQPAALRPAPGARQDARHDRSAARVTPGVDALEGLVRTTCRWSMPIRT